MGVGKVVAEVGGGIAAKKVVDKVLDNEGDDKSFGKTAVSVGAGIAAAKVIDEMMDKDDKQEEKQEAKTNGVATVAGVVAAGAAVKAAMDVNSMKKDMENQNEAERQNPFQSYEATGVNPQLPNASQNSFQAVMQQQEANLQQEVDGMGMNVDSPSLDPEFNV